MGWNIELALAQAPKGTPLEKLVPDVFEPTEQRVGFEDATSVVRDTDLCASWVAGWGVVIDVRCRLSDAAPHLKEISAHGDTFVFRIANEPVEVHYKRGKKMWKHVGLDAVLHALGRSKPKSDDDYIDGEMIATEWIHQRTKLKFTDDFWELKYAVFKVPSL
jgi:hypothetical protein